MTEVTADDAVSAKVRENALRRLAERRGYQLAKSRSRDPRAIDYGRYKIIDTATKAVATDREGAAGYTLTFADAEAFLSAARPAPAVAFAVRDDGDAARWHERSVGRWHPRNPSEILPDNWTVGWTREIPASSRSPFAGHKVVFAYEDQATGRLPDDDPRSTEFRLYGKPMRLTSSLWETLYPRENRLPHSDVPSPTLLGEPRAGTLSAAGRSLASGTGEPQHTRIAIVGRSTAGTRTRESASPRRIQRRRL
ncbi:MAG: hypothetical protein ACRDPD_31020 [Streptosporangiaceae bacterium]